MNNADKSNANIIQFIKKQILDNADNIKELLQEASTMSNGKLILAQVLLDEEHGTIISKMIDENSKIFESKESSQIAVDIKCLQYENTLSILLQSDLIKKNSSNIFGLKKNPMYDAMKVFVKNPGKMFFYVDQLNDLYNSVCCTQIGDLGQNPLSLAIQVANEMSIESEAYNEKLNQLLAIVIQKDVYDYNVLDDDNEPLSSKKIAKNIEEQFIKIQKRAESALLSLTQVDSNGESFLHHAFKNGDIESVKTLTSLILESFDTDALLNKMLSGIKVGEREKNDIFNSAKKSLNKKQSKYSENSKKFVYNFIKTKIIERNNNGLSPLSVLIKSSISHQEKDEVCKNYIDKIKDLLSDLYAQSTNQNQHDIVDSHFNKDINQIIQKISEASMRYGIVLDESNVSLNQNFKYHDIVLDSNILSDILQYADEETIIKYDINDDQIKSATEELSIKGKGTFRETGIDALFRIIANDGDLHAFLAKLDDVGDDVLNSFEKKTGNNIIHAIASMHDKDQAAALLSGFSQKFSTSQILQLLEQKNHDGKKARDFIKKSTVLVSTLNSLINDPLNEIDKFSAIAENCDLQSMKSYVSSDKKIIYHMINNSEGRDVNLIELAACSSASPKQKRDFILYILDEDKKQSQSPEKTKFQQSSKGFIYNTLPTLPYSEVSQYQGALIERFGLDYTSINIDSSKDKNPLYHAIANKNEFLAKKIHSASSDLFSKRFSKDPMSPEALLNSTANANFALLLNKKPTYDIKKHVDAENDYKSIHIEKEKKISDATSTKISEIGKLANQTEVYKDFVSRLINPFSSPVFSKYLDTISKTEKEDFKTFVSDIKEIKEKKINFFQQDTNSWHDFTTFFAAFGTIEAFEELARNYTASPDLFSKKDSPRSLMNRKNDFFGSIITTALAARNLNEDKKVKASRLTFIKHFLGEGANWEENILKENPMHIVARFNDVDGLKALLSFGSKNQIVQSLTSTNQMGETPLEIFIKNKNFSSVNQIIDYFINNNYYSELREVLLARNSKGALALHFASIYDERILNKLLIAESLINLFFGKPTSITQENAKYIYGQNDEALELIPYELAAMSGNFESFSKLSEITSVEIKNDVNKKILESMIKSNKNVNLMIVNHLLNHSVIGNLPLLSYFLECKNPSIMKMYDAHIDDLKGDYDTLISCFNDAKILQIRFFIRNGVDIFDSNNESNKSLADHLIDKLSTKELLKRDDLVELLKTQIEEKDVFFSDNTVKVHAALLFAFLNTDKDAFDKHLNKIIKRNDLSQNYVQRVIDEFAKKISNLERSDVDNFISLINDYGNDKVRNFISRVSASLIRDNKISKSSRFLLLNEIIHKCNVDDAKNIMNMVGAKNPSYISGIISDNDLKKMRSSNEIAVDLLSIIDDFIARDPDRIVLLNEEVVPDASNQQNPDKFLTKKVKKIYNSKEDLVNIDKESQNIFNKLEDDLLKIEYFDAIKYSFVMGLEVDYSKQKNLESKKQTIIEKINDGKVINVVSDIMLDNSILVERTEDGRLIADYLFDNINKEDIPNVLDKISLYFTDYNQKPLLYKLIDIYSDDVEKLKICITDAKISLSSSYENMTPIQYAHNVGATDEILGLLTELQNKEVAELSECSKSIAEFSSNHSLDQKMNFYSSKLANVMNEKTFSVRNFINYKVLDWCYSATSVASDTPSTFGKRVIAVKNLFTKVANISQVDTHNNNIMHLLLLRAKESIKDAENNNAMTKSIIMNETNQLLEAIMSNAKSSEMLKHKNIDGYTPVDLIAMYGSVKLMKTIISGEAKFALFKENFDSDALFRLASINNNEEMIEYLLSKDLKRQVNINSVDSDKRSALYHAVFGKNIQAIQSLIKNGAVIDEVDNNQRTIMHQFLHQIYINGRVDRRDVEVLSVLVGNGASIMHEDVYCSKPFDIIKGFMTLNKTDEAYDDFQKLIKCVDDSHKKLIEQQDLIKNDLIRESIITFTGDDVVTVKGSLHRVKYHTKKFFTNQHPDVEVCIKGNSMYINSNGNININNLSNKYKNDFSIYNLSFNDGVDVAEMQLDKETNKRNYIVKKGSIVITIPGGFVFEKGVKLELFADGSARIIEGEGLGKNHTISSETLSKLKNITQIKDIYFAGRPILDVLHQYKDNLELYSDKTKKDATEKEFEEFLKNANKNTEHRIDDDDFANFLNFEHDSFGIEEKKKEDEQSLIDEHMNIKGIPSLRGVSEVTDDDDEINSSTNRGVLSDLPNKKSSTHRK